MASRIRKRNQKFVIRQKDLMSRAVKAIKQKDINSLKYLLKSDLKVNGLNDHDLPLLARAVSETDDIEIIQLICDSGVDVNASNATGLTSLHLAASHGRLEILKLLVEKYNGNINVKTYLEKTPVFHAAKLGFVDIVEYLIDKGADVINRERSEETLIHEMAFEGHLDIIKLLVEKYNVDVNGYAKKDIEQTPIHLAACMGYPKIVEYLVDKGAYVDAKDELDRTPLDRAILDGQQEVVELLVEKYNAVFTVGSDLRRFIYNAVKKDEKLARDVLYFIVSYKIEEKEAESGDVNDRASKRRKVSDEGEDV